MFVWQAFTTRSSLQTLDHNLKSSLWSSQGAQLSLRLILKMCLYTMSHNSFLVSLDWGIPGRGTALAGRLPVFTLFSNGQLLRDRGLARPSMGTAVCSEESIYSSAPRIQHTLHRVVAGQGPVCAGKRQGQQLPCPTPASSGKKWAGCPLLWPPESPGEWERSLDSRPHAHLFPQ